MNALTPDDRSWKVEAQRTRFRAAIRELGSGGRGSGSVLRVPLKDEAKGELHHPGLQRTREPRKIRAHHTHLRRVEADVVKGVERFSTELDIHPLFQIEILESG